MFEQGDEVKFQDSLASVLATRRQKHETEDQELSLQVQTISGRMNGHLITTATKPAEQNPRGAKGFQLSRTSIST